MEKEAGFYVPEEDIVLLESLIKSPAFSALRRAVDRYRKECQSTLLTSSDTHKMYQTQGRIIGINVLENLPGILVAQRNQKLKQEAEEKKRLRKPESPKN